MTKSVGWVAVGLMGLSFALVSGAAKDASACGAFFESEFVPRKAPEKKLSPPELVAKAEEKLDANDARGAARSLVRAVPGLWKASLDASPLTARAAHAMALAVVRSGGDPGVGGASPAGRSANLSWAVSTLKALDLRRPNDPAIQADLGEALAKVDAHRDEARALLESLAAKDLIGSAHAYKALAALRSEKGDASGRETALARCEQVAVSPSMCRRGAEPSKPASKPAVVGTLARADVAPELLASSYVGLKL